MAQNFSGHPRSHKVQEQRCGSLEDGDASPLRSSGQPLAGAWEVSYELRGTRCLWASFWGSLVHSSLDTSEVAHLPACGGMKST